MTDVAILIPAAGASLRMRGADKLMLPLGPGGKTALRTVAEMATLAAPTVIITVPDGGPFSKARAAELHGLEARVLPLPDAHQGMSASLRAGVSAAGSADGLMILLPDMPEVTDEDIALLLDVFSADPTAIVRAATREGEAGHPVILPRRLFPEVAVLAGDEGARRVLAGEEITLVPLPGRAAVLDLDTPEDWAAWRAGRG
jgi:CTP:molybdopterin cytidylyltransferase MocA